MAKGQTMKRVQDIVEKVLTDKYVLYVVLFIAITHVLAYLGTQNFNSIIIFALAGFLTTYFTKNMVITLLVAISAGNFIHLGKTIEGMKNKEKKGGKGNKGTKESMVQGEEDEEPDEASNVPKKKSSEPKAAGIEGIDSDEEEEIEEKMTTTTTDRVKRKTTNQDTYDNIHKLLGSSNFNDMTKDTNKLMKQQQTLASAINNMAPLLDNAQNMLKGFDLSKMGGILKNFQGGLQGSKIDKTN